jgi:hypothetical protein
MLRPSPSHRWVRLHWQHRVCCLQQGDCCLQHEGVLGSAWQHEELCSFAAARLHWQPTGVAITTCANSAITVAAAMVVLVKPECSMTLGQSSSGHHICGDLFIMRLACHKSQINARGWAKVASPRSEWAVVPALHGHCPGRRLAEYVLERSRACPLHGVVPIGA